MVIQDTILVKQFGNIWRRVFFLSMLSRNKFTITNSTFLGNMARGDGGRLTFFLLANASSITAIFKNCTVSENQSKRGAGMTVMTLNKGEKPTDSVLHFIRKQS